jgi:hypothetical protein
VRFNTAVTKQSTDKQLSMAMRLRAAKLERNLPPEVTAALLRERIYGDIACLSTLLVLTQQTEATGSAWSAVLDVVVATGGLWAASVLAEYVAHLGIHGSTPKGWEFVRLLRTSGQILQAATLPCLLLIAAGFGWWELRSALWTSIWLLIATMGVFALLAARRTALSWWGRALLVLALLMLGTVVVAIKMLAH